LHPLPGVGQSLQDHPAISLVVRGNSALVDQMREWSSNQWLPDEQALAKARSRDCREAFDLHVISYNPPLVDAPGWNFQLLAICVAPRSLGSVALASSDPSVAPQIDHGFLSDPDGCDVAVLQDGVELAQRIASSRPLADLVKLDEPELEALPPGNDPRPLLARRVGIYFHPSCSCRMGPASDPLAVVDARGRVHGLDNLSICDASIYPRLMRANTNLPSAMLAEHLAPVIAGAQ
jgi:choline dehydrogenase